MRKLASHKNFLIARKNCQNDFWFFSADVLENHINYSNTICFISYDYKNNIEDFEPKNNNPLAFEPLIILNADIQKADAIFTENETHCLTQKVEIKPTVTKEEYLQKVSRLKQHIQQGDIYEINYCITFEAQDVCINPVSVFKKLDAISQAPYAALAKFNKQWIISSSPELFLKKEGNRLITKPIKGTAKRSCDSLEDEKTKFLLRNSLKEQTENVMIVDVARNDLSRIAQPGTVRVDKLFDIESFQQVHQMVSTVSCELRDHLEFKDIIKATFPMASMTGAPKIRAMELTDRYELYNRGPYSGALGYIDEHGDFELSVLIRSIFYDEEKRYLSFSVGSAITAMCNPEEEYEECLLKAKAMMEVLSA